MHRTARWSVTALSGLLVAAGAAVGVTPASAGSVTVPSPIKAAPGSVDLRSVTVDYDRGTGRLDVTLVTRGAAGFGRGYGPTYSVLLYGPRNVTGGTGQSVAAISLSGDPTRDGFPVRKGTPFTGPMIFNPVGTDKNQIVTMTMRYAGNRVEFRTQDDRLKNLPLAFFDVQTSLDQIYVASDVGTTDRLRGRIPN
ncbi:hypothetical protein [Williamsia deligens]|uniref:Uncharacterized protein n=1 Tax=Williamsia deligens TaxID=321325 RepID=A0ABW3G8E7_9NOCA|nr:hypothetical protein [Williamsia deligens]MCP2192494.1 hypothetical protein [Williamsia deligens]